MDNETSNEPLLTLTQAAKLKWLPRRRRGARPHLSTLLRWVLVGVRGVRLRAARVGNAWCLTESDLRDFFENVAAGTQPGTPAPSPSIRRAAYRRAERALDKAGVR